MNVITIRRLNTRSFEEMAPGIYLFLTCAVRLDTTSMSFEVEEIKGIVKQVLHEKIGDKPFLSEHLRQWHIEILTEILQRLKHVQERLRSTPMKYIVTVIIGRKQDPSGIGLHTALACLWDGTTDGCLTVKWENRTVFSITTVLGLTV